MNIYGLLKNDNVDIEKGFILSDLAYRVWIHSMKKSGVKIMEPVLVEGCLNKNENFIAPYNGSYGRGLVASIPYIHNGKISARYFLMYYIILK